MAELIPLEYRFEAARRKLVSRWIITGVFSLAVCGALLAYAYTWQGKRQDEYDRYSDEFRDKSALMAQAKELLNRRVELAARMQKMQELKDDKILLSLLSNVSQAFSPKDDCLEYVSVMAHNTQRGPNEPDDHKYVVHVNGITKSDTTNADLLNRLTELGVKADPPLVTTPISLRRESLQDGKVMRFEIVAEKPEPKKS